MEEARASGERYRQEVAWPPQRLARGAAPRAPPEGTPRTPAPAVDRWIAKRYRGRAGCES
ncbi:hypothetical protein PSMK_29980 [Phycisphaera mikurensis NBRC 102666]|uniref:Uncharacterized protein n=1 Tax=Phycisphaera mikurensis (strain NBRC 102666 / KCTC 22515 / FYK2301M01) TaxID=1142394 RepID=I0IIR9_PHYMF|nr:hypothetical protein PSMK_29980 [Phycisphaera mikurensis NBRC 102666]